MSFSLHVTMGRRRPREFHVHVCADRTVVNTRADRHDIRPFDDKYVCPLNGLLYYYWSEKLTPCPVIAGRLFDREMTIVKQGGQETSEVAFPLTVSEIRDGAFINNYKLNRILLGKTIRVLEDYCFAYTRLFAVTIPA